MIFSESLAFEFALVAIPSGSRIGFRYLTAQTIEGDNTLKELRAGYVVQGFVESCEIMRSLLANLGDRECMQPACKW